MTTPRLAVLALVLCAVALAVVHYLQNGSTSADLRRGNWLLLGSALLLYIAAGVSVLSAGSPFNLAAWFWFILGTCQVAQMASSRKIGERRRAEYPHDDR